MIDLKKDERVCKIVVAEIKRAEEAAKERNGTVALTKQVAAFTKELIINYHEVCKNMIGISKMMKL